MQVIDRIDAFRKELDAARAAGKTVGLVPTMGYLHEGHRSLIERSARLTNARFGAYRRCDTGDAGSGQHAEASG